MKKHLVPKEGIKVRDPLTGAHFPVVGSNRIMTSYYTRRVNDGDLIVKEVKTECPKETKAGKSKIIKGGE